MRPLRDVADPYLVRILREREDVLHVFAACSPASLIERTLLGSGLEHVRRCIVALTNERLILIAVTRNLALRDSLSHIAIGDIASTTFNNVTRTMTLHFRSGKSQRFSDIARADLDVLRDVLPRLRGNGTAARQRESLCPCCLQPLRRGSQVCPSCRSPMKRRDKAVKLSWAWPGGGYAYLGFPQMATLAAIAECGLVVMFLLTLRAALRPGGFFAAIAVVCITIAAVEWKSAVASHAGSLSDETFLDHDRDDELRATPLHLLKVIRETLFERDSDSSSYVWIERGEPMPQDLATRTDPAIDVAMRKVGPALERLLDTGERVLMISRGSLRHRLVDIGAPSAAVVILSRRCWFVFTSKRILRIAARSRSVRVIPYSAIAAVRFDTSYWFGVVLRYAVTLVDRHGAHESVAGLSVHDFDKVRSFLPAAIGRAPEAGTAAENLCPSCSAPLADGVFNCSRCAVRFRDPAKATFLAAALPGGGYFYTGYPLLGVVAAATDLFLISAALSGYSLRVTLTAVGAFAVHKFVCIAHAREFAWQYVLGSGAHV